MRPLLSLVILCSLWASDSFAQDQPNPAPAQPGGGVEDDAFLRKALGELRGAIDSVGNTKGMVERANGVIRRVHEQAAKEGDDITGRDANRAADNLLGELQEELEGVRRGANNAMRSVKERVIPDMVRRKKMAERYRDSAKTDRERSAYDDIIASLEGNISAAENECNILGERLRGLDDVLNRLFDEQTLLQRMQRLQRSDEELLKGLKELNDALAKMLDEAAKLLTKQ